MPALRSDGVDGADSRARAPLPPPAPRRFLDSLDQLVAGCDQEYRLLQDEKRKIQRCVKRELAADVHEANSRLVRQRIEQMQLELPVLIAQLRSVSMEVVDAVVSWRVRAHTQPPCELCVSEP